DRDRRELARPRTEFVHRLMEMENILNIAALEAMLLNHIAQNEIFLAIDVVVIDLRQARHEGRLAAHLTAGVRPDLSPQNIDVGIFDEGRDSLRTTEPVVF